VPAHIAIDTDDRARVRVNGRIVADVVEGTAIFAYEPNSNAGAGWIMRAHDEPSVPLADDRLRRGYVLSRAVSRDSPDLPVVSNRAVAVRFGPEGDAWFEAGWHGPEGTGDASFRWTSAYDAFVRVLVNKRQPLRVELGGRPAAESGAPGALTASWNGVALHPRSGSRPSDSYEWVVPASLVRRGTNTLGVHVTRLVVPAAQGGGGDARSLGAVVNRLVFVPASADR
jgi:hypothetical protein